MKQSICFWWLIVSMIGIFQLSAKTDEYKDVAIFIKEMTDSMKTFHELAESSPKPISLAAALERLTNELELSLRKIRNLFEKYPKLHIGPWDFLGAPENIKESCFLFRREYIDAMERIQCMQVNNPDVLHVQEATRKFFSLNTKPFSELLDMSENLLSCDHAKIEKFKELLLAGEGNDHDWPSDLAETGDVSCVPALIAVLKRNPIEEDGSMICTREHCLVALRKLTGKDLGDTDDVWIRWWAEYQEQQKKN